MREHPLYQLAKSESHLDITKPLENGGVGGIVKALEFGREQEGQYYIECLTQVGGIYRERDLRWKLMLTAEEASDLLKKTGQEMVGELTNDVTKLFVERLEQGRIIVENDKRENLLNPVILEVPEGWDKKQCVNELIRELEYKEQEKRWERGVPPHSIMENLYRFLDNPDTLTDHFVGWDKDQLIDVQEFLDTVREWKKGGRGTRWLELIERREQSMSAGVRQTLETLLKPGTVKKYGMDVQVDEIIKIWTQEFDKQGRVDEKIILKGIQLLATKLGSEKKIDYKTIADMEAPRIANEMRLIWARGLVRRQLEKSKDGKGEYICSQEMLDKALRLVYKDARVNQGLELESVYSEVVLYPEEMDGQVNMRRNFRDGPKQIRNELKNYLMSIPVDENLLEDFRKLKKIVADWLSKLGMAHEADNEYLWKSLMEVQNEMFINMEETSPKDLSWREIFESFYTSTCEKYEDFVARDLVENVKNSNFSSSVNEVLISADATLSNKGEIWRMWQDELRLVLQRWAYRAQALVGHWEKRWGYATVQFDDEDVLNRIRRYHSDIYQEVAKMKLITDELGWEVAPDIEGYIRAVSNQALISDKTASPNEGKIMIFSPQGARLREKMGEE